MASTQPLYPQASAVGRDRARASSLAAKPTAPQPLPRGGWSTVGRHPCAAKCSVAPKLHTSAFAVYGQPHSASGAMCPSVPAHPTKTPEGGILAVLNDMRCCDNENRNLDMKDYCGVMMNNPPTYTHTHTHTILG